jgi:hypothetical protein
MTPVAEIKAAIEKLSHAQVGELAVWFEEFQQLINSSCEIFAVYEKEEREDGQTS